MKAILLAIPGSLTCFALERVVMLHVNCSTKEKIIMSLNEVQAVRLEKKRRQIGGIYNLNPSFTG